MTVPSITHFTSQDFTAEEFQSRRQRVATEIGAGAAALLQGAPRAPTPHPDDFAQSKNFDYLCGIRLERSYLLIEGDHARTTLFVPAEGLCNVKGGKLDEATASALCETMNIEQVLNLDALQAKLEPFSTLHVLHCADEEPFATKFGLMGAARMRAEDPLDGGRRRDELLVENLKALFPKMEIADLAPIISQMRLIKSPAEIAVMRKTGAMSARACMECMRATKPGMPTGAFHAIADYVFRQTGNCGHAYDFMCEPSHPDSEVLVDGDLVLVDCGPDYHGYTMDIARMWPINGVFDEWQRHTFGLITDYHKVLLELGKAGSLIKDVYENAAAIMLKKYEGDDAGQAILENMISRGVSYFNHHVGLSVHDAVAPWKDEPMKEGMVVTVDPMVWLTDAPHGYVRVEDTVVIRADGCERLTGAAPFEIDEVEQFMQEPGQFPVDLTL